MSIDDVIIKVHILRNDAFCFHIRFGIVSAVAYLSAKRAIYNIVNLAIVFQWDCCRGVIYDSVLRI